MIYHNDKKEKTRAIFDTVITGALVASMFSVLIGFLAIVMPKPIPALAAETGTTATATNEQELVTAVNNGAEYIDVSAFGWDYNTSGNMSFYIRELDGMPRCLSRNSGIMVAKGDVRLIRAFKPRYDCDPSQVAARNKAYWDEVNRIASEAQGTQYEKAQYVYDALMARCSYHYPSVVSRDVYGSHCTATSALLDGQSICAGYADALVDLFGAIGIEAWVEENGEHAWVGCYLDGERLTCDPTTDDAFDARSHDHFMISGDGKPFRPGYTVSATVLPPAAAGEASSAETTWSGEAQVIAQASYETQAPATDTPAPQDKPYNRIAIGACKVAVLKGDLVPANQTIYMAADRGFWTPFAYESGLTLYAEVNDAGLVNGKPIIALEMPNGPWVY